MKDAAAALARAVEEAGDRPRARRIRRRSCGECRACCEHIGVREELPPPHNEAVGPCPLLCAAGCSIYARRPATCRQYLCGWRAGLGEERDRPDRAGWIIDLQSTPGRAAPHQVRFIRTRVDATVADRDELAARCAGWLQELSASGSAREAVTYL